MNVSGAINPALGRKPDPPRERPRAPAGLAPDASKSDDASYTNRLLKAKQRVWEDREKEKDKRNPRTGQ